MSQGSLVEREGPLLLLGEALDRLAAGRGGVVLVTGEAGIGKTALIEAALAGAPAGVRVRRGACDDLVTANPLGPIREAFAESGGRPAGLGASGPAHDVFDLLLAQIQKGPPSVLAIEDLHWADDATIDVLAWLARRAEQLPLLVIASFRDDEVGPEHPAQRAVTAAATATRIRLHPLTVAGVARLCGTGRWAAADLHAVTSGNPFFVTESLAAPDDTELPASVTAAVLGRLCRLSPPARLALERISVWTGILGFDLAEDLLGADLDQLAEAEQVGLVIAARDGLRFRHELARRATEGSLTTLRRRLIDREIIEVLKRRGEDDLPRLVHHALSCGDHESVAEFAPRAAARSARLGANRQALAFYRLALEREHLLPRPVLAEVLDGYAWELYNAHRFDAAVQQSQRAVRLFAKLGDRSGESRARVRLSRHLFMAAEPDAAQDCARAAVGLAGPGDPEALAPALTSLGALLALDDAPAEATDVLRRAQSAAAPGSSVDVLCRNYLSVADIALGAEDRVGLLRDSLELAHAANEYEGIARAYTNLGELYYRLQRYDDLEAHLADGLAFVREHGFWSHAYNLEVHHALLRMRRGDWDAAESELGVAVGRYEDPGMLLLYSRAPLARLRVRRGEPGAEDDLWRCWELARRQRLLVGLGFAATGLIEWAWLAGRRDIAESVLVQWQQHAHRPTAEWLDAEIRRYAARCGIDVASPDGPTDAENLASPWAHGLRGDWRAAATMWGSVGDSYERALELAESGEPGPMVEALGLLLDLGARPAAGWLRERLAALGVTSIPRGPNRQTRSNPAGLTDRQLDVAHLVADGLTNAEIAEELFLSVRTVDHHVASILLKLEVPNRRRAGVVVRSWQTGPQSTETGQRS